MKESRYHRDKDVIFRETFRSLADVNDNGGSITNITFDNGIGSSTGASSDYAISYKKSFVTQAATTISFWTKFTSNSTMCIIGCDNDKYAFRAISFQNGYVAIDYASSNNELGNTTQINDGLWHHIVIDIANRYIYIDGIKENTTTNGAAGISSAYNSLFSRFSGVIWASPFTGSIDLVDIYNRTLTLEEISALSKNKLYTKPSLQNTVLNIPVIGSIYDTKGNVITNTDVDVNRDGSKDVMVFNGISSRLVFPSALQLNLSTFTYAVWVKRDSNSSLDLLTSYGATPNYNEIRLDTLDRLFIETNTSGDQAYASLNSSSEKWTRLVITVNSGTVAMYQDGVALSMSDNTISNSTLYVNIIGSNALASLYMCYTLKDKLILNSVWTPEEVARDYNSTKHNYNL